MTWTTSKGFHFLSSVFNILDSSLPSLLTCVFEKPLVVSNAFRAPELLVEFADDTK